MFARRSSVIVCALFALGAIVESVPMVWAQSAASVLSSPPVPPATSQQAPRNGVIRGHVELAGQGPVDGAIVLLTDIGRSTRTDEQGNFEITGLAPATFTVVVQRPGLGSDRQRVTVTAGQTATLSVTLQVQGRSEEVTVTASATGATTAFDTFNAVQSLDSLKLSKDMSGTLGEVLENEPGVAKRGYGVGNSRPIIRGFDGDRVLILEDGVRTGDVSSQSGDHGTTIDPANVDRIEVVRGPATLLYGSNAVGGVVNAISPEQMYRTTPHDGLQAGITFDGGSANEQAGGNGNFIYGQDNWMLYGAGGSRRTGDYDTPIGTIPNSQTDLSNGRLGFGYFGDSASVDVGYRVEHSNYGVPFAGDFEDPGAGLLIQLEPRRESVRVNFGTQAAPGSFIESASGAFDYIDYRHAEVEVLDGEREEGTVFNNRTYVARGELSQAKTGRLHGKLGVWYQNRDFSAAGEEVLAPPTVQNAMAGFAYEELDFDGWRLQFGGRAEWNDYQPEAREEGEEEGGGEEELVVPAAEPRSFTGASGSVGIQVDVQNSSSFVVNATSSYRAPALEELYNFGPHVGNLTFEVGDPTLERERANGVDVSLRHASSRASANLNVFYYAIDNFVFIDLSDEIEDGLRIGNYMQGDSRFAGVDAAATWRAHEHMTLAATLGWVDAELTGSGTPLPRIPPLRGQISVEIPYRQLSVKPELVLAAAQNDVFPGEPTTDGYTLLNLGASYTLVRGRTVHLFSVKGYNLTDELYYNASSFIKDLAPEIGRGVKFGYTLKVF